jgi:uridylate kinase
MGEQKFGVEHLACEQIGQAIKEVYALGVQLGIVVGGGNIFRGNQADAFGFARTPADHIGMLATTINGLVLQQTLASLGVDSRVMSALNTDSIVEPYHWGHALHSLQKGVIVIFVGGTGNPYFTTDSAAALRASEMQAQVLLKGTKVDGIFSADPKIHPQAEKYDELTYSEVLAKNLNVMDATAIALCRENHIPICVFNLFERGAMLKAVCGQQTGSLVRGG